MEEVLYYLELKNQYYEKFFSITKKFLSQAAVNRWDDIDYLVDNRERILNIIRSYDFKVAQAFSKLSLTSFEIDAYRLPVKALLDERESLGKRIVAQDLELVSMIEEARIDTIRELKKVQDTSQKLSSFSAPTPPMSRKPTKDA